MEAQTEEDKRAARREAQAEALAFFIKEPKAITDPTLKIGVDFFKERIAQELERHAKGLGNQHTLKVVR